MDAALTKYNCWGGIKSQGTCDDKDRLSLSFSSDLGQRFSDFQVTILRGTFFS